MTKPRYPRAPFPWLQGSTVVGKVRLIGNSVCPEVAEAVVRANALPMAEAVA